MNSVFRIFAATLFGGLVAGILAGMLLMLTVGVIANGMLNNAVQQAQGIQIDCSRIPDNAGARISIDGNIFYCRLLQPEERKQEVKIMHSEDGNSNDETEDETAWIDETN